MWRDFAIAMSLANLCYLRLWSELLTYRLSDTFWMKTPPEPRAYAAIMLNVLIVGGLFFGGIRLIRLTKTPFVRVAGRWLFLILLLVPLNGLRDVMSNRVPYLRSELFDLMGQKGVEYLLVGLVLIGVLLLAFMNRQMTHIASVVLLILTPFVAFTFSEAIVKIVHFNPRGYSDKPVVPSEAQRTPNTRVVWIIFDEMDYRLAFVDRDPTLSMPEFDKLREDCLFATEAQSPGPGTPISMPSLLLGKPVKRVSPVRSDDLRLTFSESGDQADWSTLPNLFSDARELGVNSAVVDWYIPSCRIFSQLFTSCSWHEMGMQYNSMAVGLASISGGFATELVNQTRSLFETSLLSAFGQSLATKQQIRTYHEILQESDSLIADPNFGIVFLHFPVPHAPHAYDRKTGQFTLANSPIRGYVDSLALTDRTLGELRARMTAAGTWDNTNILISADHPYREASALDGKMDGRVPFLLKLANEKEGLVFDGRFSALVTRDLIVAILRNELSTPRAVSDWIHQHGEQGRAVT